MKRSPLMLSILVAVATMVALGVAQASVVSHGLGELDKLVRGEPYTINFPGGMAQVTEINLPGANPALSKRPHPADAYYLQGVMVEFAITFFTGDYEGRPGQVLFSGDVGGFTVDNLCLSDSRDSGGMNLLTTFPKETKRIRFVWTTAGYETGSYTFLVENFPRSKRQQYSEIAIPVFLAASKADVSAALANADNETLKRYGLRRLSEVIKTRQTPAWTGNINLSDGAVLRSVALPRTPEVGMAIAIIDGYDVVGGGIVKSVNGESCSIDMASQALSGYEDRISKLTAKLAYRAEVVDQGEPEARASEPPDTISGGSQSPVPGRKYLVFGRDPMVPGGITSLKDGQSFVSLPYDTWITMRGAHGEWVSGWAQAGTVIVARMVKKGDITAYRAEAVQVCGNTVREFHFPAPTPPTPPAKPVVHRHTIWIPVDIQQEIAEQVSVIDWDYTGAPVLAAKDLERLQANRPGILSVIWSLNPTRNTNNNGSESNSAAAASATAKNDTDIGINMQQQQGQ